MPLDSKVVVDNIKEYISLVIGKNVEANLCNYCEFEFSFENKNKKSPSHVMVENIKILYDNYEKNNQNQYKKILELIGYNTSFKSVTLIKDDIVSFKCIALLNDEEFKNLKSKLVESKKIDIISSIKFINPSGVVTSGEFKSNLMQSATIMIGDKKAKGSNKVLLNYDAVNTYFDFNKIEYKK